MAAWLGRMAHWFACEAAADLDYGTVPWDGMQWEFDAPAAGVIAVGDLQGDLVGLDAILRLCGMVDVRGDWCGGGRHLVLAGDLIGGHADARLCIEFVMRLEQQAARAGGWVHSLLGNHDLLPARGEIAKWTHGEKQSYREHPPAGAPTPRARDAFRGDSEPARWLRRRNAIVRIGDTLFAHAGLGPWCRSARPGAVNATVRAWIAHWQGRAAAPPPATQWAVGAPGMARESALACGPLWTRRFKPAGAARLRGAPTRAELGEWLQALGTNRLVVGHAPLDAAAIALEHPYYGASVVMLDTRIVDPQRGSLSALRLDAHGLRAMRFAAECRDAGCRARELARLGVAVAAPTSWWVRVGAALLRLFGVGRAR